MSFRVLSLYVLTILPQGRLFYKALAARGAMSASLPWAGVATVKRAPTPLAGFQFGAYPSLNDISGAIDAD